MEERLTWDEICEKYPERWVGLSEVEYEEDCFNVKTAVVKYWNLGKNGILRKQLVEHEDIISRTTYKYL